MSEHLKFDPIVSTEIDRPLDVRDSTRVEVLPEHSDFILVRQMVATLLSGIRPEMLKSDGECPLGIYEAEHVLPNGDRLFLEITQDYGDKTFDPTRTDDGYNVHHFSPLAEFDKGLVVRRRYFDLTPPRTWLSKHYDESAEKLFQNGILGKQREFEKSMDEIIHTNYAEMIKAELNRSERLLWDQAYESITTYDMPAHEWLVLHLRQLSDETLLSTRAASWYEMLRSY